MIIKDFKPRYFTEYDAGTVRWMLQNFPSNKFSNWSCKRKGYIIECPDIGSHSENNRRDDCVVYAGDSQKNGFIWISMRCRHNSCWTTISDYCRGLNKEWGTYLNKNYTI